MTEEDTFICRGLCLHPDKTIWAVNHVFGSSTCPCTEIDIINLKCLDLQGKTPTVAVAFRARICCGINHILSK
jgi:hypothetical protein